ncbi:MAG TPA: hemerythrin domain-containing protein [Burkholderiales bacterium]|nr:hemerythrin domain-containing protein [Betaproteobacteria bacterium]HQR53960.1 hemerythrin domain-containing protein [Burkholderiales bacterium]
MTLPLVPALPGFDEPIEMLRACHDRIAHQCTTLERLVPHLKRHGCDQTAREAAAGVLRYFTLAGPHHHADEERDLFPRLLDVATGEDAQRAALLVTSMVADHREMERLWSEIEPALAAIARGAIDGLDGVLVGAFCTVYRNHMAIEENDVIALAERVLPPAALTEIGWSMSIRRGVKPPEAEAPGSAAPSSS